MKDRILDFLGLAIHYVLDSLYLLLVWCAYPAMMVYMAAMYFSKEGGPLRMLDPDEATSGREWARRYTISVLILLVVVIIEFLIVIGVREAPRALRRMF